MGLRKRHRYSFLIQINCFWPFGSNLALLLLKSLAKYHCLSCCYNYYYLPGQQVLHNLRFIDCQWAMSWTWPECNLLPEIIIDVQTSVNFKPLLFMADWIQQEILTFYLQTLRCNISIGIHFILLVDFLNFGHNL